MTPTYEYWMGWLIFALTSYLMLLLALAPVYWFLYLLVKRP